MGMTKIMADLEQMGDSFGSGDSDSDEESKLFEELRAQSKANKRRL